MSNIGKALAFVTVSRKPGDPSRGVLRAGGRGLPCALGKGGVSALKREGDGATPIARMAVLDALYRGDTGVPRAGHLKPRRIRSDDGWCDAPRDRNYNRPVRLPYAASHERMIRADHLYDRVVVLDWNISSRRRGAGSAIFLHLAKPGYQPTEGCIAVSRATMDWLLPRLSRRTVVRVLG
jgi:L,D-peptidoglycan transpeptidase YkuD (ErfK/YbiS/YcfS/YnhG family)